jgi:hypothetical protein
MVEDVFPKYLKPVETTVTFPHLQLRFDPMPKEVEEVWEVHAARMRGYIENVPTRFSKKVSLLQAFQFAKSVVDAIEDKEVREINLGTIMSWAKDIKAGIHRGTFDPYMYLARALLPDPFWYPKSRKNPFKWSNPLPNLKISPIDTWDFAEIKIPSQGNVGFWRLEPWNRPQRAPAENQLFHEQIFDSCKRWKEAIDSLPRITPKLVQAVSPLLAGFHRSQGRGRVVFALAKAVAFWMMFVTQKLQARLSELGVVWFGSGDRMKRLKQMMSVLNGEPGTHSVDGDDFTVKAGDGIVSGDTSSHDGSVNKFQHEEWLKAIAEIVSEEVAQLYRACCYAAWTADAAISVGLLRRVPLQGTVSGTPDTKLENTWNQSARVGSCNWKLASLGIEQLSQFGIYRQDRQFVMDYTASMCQLVVSDAYPGAIFGLVGRVIRALLEREDWSTVDTLQSEDVRIVQICSNLYGMPYVHEKVCKWVKNHWEIRVSEATVKALQREFGRRIKGYGNSSYHSSGIYERKSLTETYRLLAV